MRVAKVDFLSGMLAPIRKGYCAVQGPVCLICQDVVEEESIVEEKRGDHNFCKVLVRCHGDEELCTFEFGSSDWDYRELHRRMQAKGWFDPESALSLGFLKNVVDKE